MNNQPMTLLRSLKTRLININRLFLFSVLIPTSLSIIYFAFIASDVYISESRFVVRNPEHQTQTGLGALIQGTGFSRSQDDTYNVHEFMLSRDALNQINNHINLREVFGKNRIDIFNNFNTLGVDNSIENLYRYYLKRVEINLNTSTSISVLKVRTANAEDSYRINELLLQIGEQFVNRLNDRGRKDLIDFSKNELDIADQKSKAAAKKLAIFRSKNEVFDPDKQSTLQLQHISRIQDQLISTKTQLSQVKALTPESPQIPALKNLVASIQAELNSEMAKVSGNGSSFTNKAVEYQLLVLDLSVADKQLALAMASLEEARRSAQKKQIYLDRIQQPNKPDMALEPFRVRNILSVFLLGIITWAILSMMVTGIREHHD